MHLHVAGTVIKQQTRLLLPTSHCGEGHISPAARGGRIRSQLSSGWKKQAMETSQAERKTMPWKPVKVAGKRCHGKQSRWQGDVAIETSQGGRETLYIETSQDGRETLPWKPVKMAGRRCHGNQSRWQVDVAMETSPSDRKTLPWKPFKLTGRSCHGNQSG